MTAELHVPCQTTAIVNGVERSASRHKRAGCGIPNHARTEHGCSCPHQLRARANRARPTSSAVLPPRPTEKYLVGVRTESSTSSFPGEIVRAAYVRASCRWARPHRGPERILGRGRSRSCIAPCGASECPSKLDAEGCAALCGPRDHQKIPLSNARFLSSLVCALIRRCERKIAGVCRQ